MKTIAIHNGHGASVAYMNNGNIEFAIQEERLSRVKNQAGFPKLAIKKLFEEAGINIDEIDKFIFSDFATIGIGVEGQDSSYWRKKFHSMFEQNPSKLNFNMRKIIMDGIRHIPVIEKKLSERFIKNLQEDRMRPLIEMGIPKEKILFMDHHTCHASSAGYGWGKKEPFIIITSDGVGDEISGSISIFRKGRIERIATIPQTGSLALIYAMTTSYLGLQPIEHEYKLMGMSPYAENTPQAMEIAKKLEGLFEFNEDGLTYQRVPKIKNRDIGAILKKIFEYQRFDHISAGVQIFTEDFVVKWIKQIIDTLHIKNVAFSGGFFMNVKLNKKIMEIDNVEDIFIFPSCGDETNVFGALYNYHYNKTGNVPTPLKTFCLGKSYSDEEILSAIHDYKFKRGVTYSLKDNILETIAKLLADGKIIARFDGREEFGARALGNRSILADPRNSDIIKIINKMIKSRDFWMPFAPSCIDINTYFKNKKKISSPHMMLTFDAKKEKIKDMKASIHPYDNTARPQEVTEDNNKSYWQLIKKFEKITNRSIILNTSFNLHGFPIVHSPKDALYVFDNSGLEYLAIGNYIVTKKNPENI